MPDVARRTRSRTSAPCLLPKAWLGRSSDIQPPTATLRRIRGRSALASGNHRHNRPGFIGPGAGKLLSRSCPDTARSKATSMPRARRSTTYPGREIMDERGLIRRKASGGSAVRRKRKRPAGGRPIDRPGQVCTKQLLERKRCSKVRFVNSLSNRQSGSEGLSVSTR